MTSGKVQPIHYDKQTVKELNKQLFLAGFIGATKGGLTSVTSLFVLGKLYPQIKNLRLPIKIFVHCALITTGVIFTCESQLNKFQLQYYQNEIKRRQNLIDYAADNGIFLNDDYVSQSVIIQDDSK